MDISMKTTLEIIEQVRERQEIVRQQEIDELERWRNIPAYQTENDIIYWSNHFLNKKYDQEIFIVLRVYTPVIDIKSTWKCYYLFRKKDGTILHEDKASSDFCESIFSNKEWKEENYPGNISFFKKPLGNLIFIKKKKNA